MKKIISLLLCMAMILALGVTAFAAGEKDEQIVTVIPPAVLISPVGGDLDILVAPVVQSDVLAPYTDWIKDAWYVDGLAFCVANGLMVGTSDTTIEPEKTITRGEIVQILYRLAGKPEYTFENKFTDVVKDAWYEDAVLWTSSTNIAAPLTETTFGPDEVITREDLVVMLFNYAKYDAEQNGESVNKFYPNLALTFDDTKEISEEAMPAVRWAVAEKIINGRDGNKFAPEGSTMRAEAAAIFQRFGLTPAESAEGQLAGGWQRYYEQTELDLTKIPEEAKNAIELLNKSIDGAKRTPIVYLGSQVVAGTNYKFICRIEPLVLNGPKGKLAVVTICEDLNKGVTILNEEEISIDMFATDGSIKFPEAGLVGAFGTEDIAGGFESVEYGTAGSTDKYGLEASAKEAFETATKDLTGVGYRPLMLLSSQVVAGTNYRILCVATRVTAQPAKALCLVQVYGALDGTAELKVIGNCNF